MKNFLAIILLSLSLGWCLPAQALDPPPNCPSNGSQALTYTISNHQYQCSIISGGGGGSPGGTSGQIQYNNSGSFGGFTTSGDATINTGTGGLTLGTVNSNVGSFTNANITVNAKGLITAASNGSAGGTITLGTSAAATNPQRSGQAGTGLYSAATNTVSVAANGSGIADLTSAGITSATFVPTGSTAPATGGLYFPASAPSFPAIGYNGAVVARFGSSGTVANSLIFNAYSTGNNPNITALGSDTNVGLDFYSQAAGVFNFKSLGIANTRVNIGVTNNTTGQLGIVNGSASGKTVILTAASGMTAADWTFTLPTTAGTSGYVLQTDGAGVTSWVSAGAGGGVSSWSGDGSLFTNSASTGAVTATLGNQTANTVLAGPTSGGAASPAFRALVLSDLPMADRATTAAFIRKNQYGGFSAPDQEAYAGQVPRTNKINLFQKAMAIGTTAPPITNSQLTLYSPSNNGAILALNGNGSVPASAGINFYLANTLRASINVSSFFTNGHMVINPTGYLQVYNALVVDPSGVEGNIAVNAFDVQAGNSSSLMFTVAKTNTTTNGVMVTGAATGSSPTIAAIGSSDTNVVLTLSGKGVFGTSVANSQAGNVNAAVAANTMANFGGL